MLRPPAGPGTWKGGSRRTFAPRPRRRHRPLRETQTFSPDISSAERGCRSARRLQPKTAEPSRRPSPAFQNARPAAVTLQPIPSGCGPATNQRPAFQARRVELRPRHRAARGAGLFRCRPGQAWGQAFPAGLCACARPAAGGRRVRCSVPPGCRADARAAARATMTDYGEEQRNEMEALESIYPDSFTVLSENPPSFTITVTSEAGENDETVQTTLKFTYSEKYPDEAPLYEIFSQENLEDNDVSDILKLLALQAEENLGMVMIFTLVTAVQEKLNEIVDQIKTRREEEKKQKEKEAEEAEKKLFHGTPVTIENFLSWKAKFDAELLEIKKKRMKEEEQAGKNKLSGKQLFETDHNLDTSDIRFLEDAGNNVEVDESLFQEMDDLELEDGDDDPDYNPVAAGSDSD